MKSNEPSCDVSIEYAHTYTNADIGQEQELALETLGNLETELQLDAKTLTRTVLVDDYSFPDLSFDYDAFTVWLKRQGFGPAVVLRESQLIPACDDVIKIITNKKLKNELTKYIQNHKYPCSLFIAAWYLVRLGHLKFSLFPQKFCAKKLINILPTRFKPFEIRALEIIQETKFTGAEKNISHIYVDISTKISGEVTVPSQWKGKTNFLIPDEMAQDALAWHGLLNSNIQCVDPMAGLFTIPRIMKRNNTPCLGIEIEPERYDAVKNEPWFDSKTMLLGDYRKLLPTMGQFGCIFTSFPFEWFGWESDFPSDEYAQILLKSLKPKGFLLVDSVPNVIRDSIHEHVAGKQKQYLERNGFVLTETKMYKAQVHADIDPKAVIMKFIKSEL